jgi:hypothetical protein
MRRLLVVLVAATALLSGTVSASAGASAVVTPPQSDAPAVLAEGDPTATADERAAAAEALETVQTAFAPKSAAAARAQLANDPAAANPTLALRDLSVLSSGLNRAPAGSTLAQFQRPWDDGALGEETKPAGNILVHYLPSDTHPLNADATTRGWAQTTANALSAISTAYVNAGYRQPKADAPFEYNPYSTGYHGTKVNYGGTTQTDVYLKDLGGTGVYGYCAYDRDDSGRLVYLPQYGDVPAFCVLDNDFATTQYRPTYPGETSEDILKVTAAHEYFHAVQFAYDAFEDSWFMEATATWAERQVYPAIPDNNQFLPYSPLRFPGTSIDTWAGNGGFLQYGDWIFFEYLTQRFPTPTGPLPNLVRTMWEYADSRGPDQYSIQAVTTALATRGASLPTVFAQFSAANLRPAATYTGGSAYPASQPRRNLVVRAHRKRTGTARIDHLASYTVRLKPKAIRKAGRRATLSVDLARRSLGTAAIATVYLRNGQVAVRPIKLSARGNGSIRVAFSTAKVARVDLTLVNANQGFRSCSAYQQGYSCGGTPLHDDLTSIWTLRT